MPKNKKRIDDGRLPKKKKFNFWNIQKVISLHDELLYSLLGANSSVNSRLVPKKDKHIFVDFTRTQDGNKVSFYYLIEKYPSELPINFKERLRRECRGNVRLNFINVMNNHTIEWNSPQMASRLRFLREKGKEDSQKDVDAYNMHKNIGDMTKQALIEDSLLYLSDADKVRGRALLKSSTLVIISGDRGEDFDNSVKSIEKNASNLGLGMKRLLYDIPAILKYYSPFNHTLEKELRNNLPIKIFTDEIISRFNTYTQGKVGTKGIYVGTDVYSLLPVVKQFKLNPDALENILVSAASEGGKSFMVKMLIIQLLALNYNGTIMDIEGEEYTPIANYTSYESNVITVNMAEGSGKYVDPVAIPKATGVYELDKDRKTLSINYTLTLYKVLLGESLNRNPWLNTVIDDAVTELYKDHGITDDMSTWELSANLTLFDVYSNLMNLEHFRADENYRSAVKEALALTSKYFEEDGVRGSLFREKVNIESLIDADLVVCSFGMAGKSPQAVDEIQMALMQLGAAQISHQRSLFSKAQGKFNFKVWEEFQRWGKFPNSDKTIGVAVTGGRKLGDINIIVTNKLKELLDDDKFGILDNLSSFFVGRIKDDKTREQFCERLSLPLMKKELDLIASAVAELDSADGDNTVSMFKFAFLCSLDDNDFAITKMLLPNDIKKSKLFRSGVDVNININKEGE